MPAAWLKRFINPVSLLPSDWSLAKATAAGAAPGLRLAKAAVSAGPPPSRFKNGDSTPVVARPSASNAAPRLAAALMSTRLRLSSAASFSSSVASPESISLARRWASSPPNRPSARTAARRVGIAALVLSTNATTSPCNPLTRHRPIRPSACTLNSVWSLRNAERSTAAKSPSGLTPRGEAFNAAHATAWLSGVLWKFGSKIVRSSFGAPRVAMP